jgi:cytochrome c oxidase cbb3-type subunit 2
VSKNYHEVFEKSAGWLAIGTVLAISFGTLVEITPLLFLKETTEPVDGLKPYTALQLEGRDIYIREGCVTAR